MKRFLLYIFLLLGTGYAAHAQDEPGKNERIKALYVAYVTDKLNLTPDEAKKFWPVHSQFDAEVKAVDIDMDELPRQQKILDIKVKYQDRFNNILGNARSNTFFKLDGEFRRRLVDTVRKNRQQNNMMRPGKRRNN